MTYISRIVSLKGRENVICGRDMGNILEEGVVYGVQKRMCIITLIPIGEGVPVPDGVRMDHIFLSGRYLLIKDEYRNQLIKEEFLDADQIERAVQGTDGDDWI